MFQYFQEFDQVFTGARDLDVSRHLNTSLQTLDEWLAQNKDRILVQ